MKKLFIMFAAALALGACHMDEHAVGESIFKEKGACASPCKKSTCKKAACKCCNKMKKAEHSHDKGACGLRKAGKSSKSHAHGTRACGSHTHDSATGHGHAH
ncbi:MAG: hypothetical protein P8P30_08495 [Rickettsiales bacterium]|nr:hypothetical protein [Rickettsiales bacterium]